MDNDWAYNEIAHVPLWDERCRHNLSAICQKLAENAELSVSRALGSLRKSLSRLLHHEQTTPQDLLKGHVLATARRCAQQNFVLVASDTTSFNFTTHQAVQGLGPIADKSNAFGGESELIVHSPRIPENSTLCLTITRMVRCYC